MRRTILLADDSPTIRKLVTQTFAESDFDVVSVSNGDAAIKTFEETRPALVLADVYMPGKNGYEVCKYIRNHSQRSVTPVVLLVGAFDAFDAEAAKQLGATANIKKPFEPGSLIDIVMSLVPALAEDPAADVANEIPVTDGESVQDSDLLGLEDLFKDETVPVSALSAASLTDGDLDRIADRVIQRISTHVIENIAWDVVPDITAKIVREELKKNEG